MRPPSVMNHQYGLVPRADIPRSSFNRSHGYKTTFDSGYLIPFYCDEALPGDTFSLKASLFARLATPIVPIMDNMFMETFFFAVPLRLIWSNFKKFFGEQRNPSDSTDYLVPIATTPAYTCRGAFRRVPQTPRSSLNSSACRSHRTPPYRWFVMCTPT